MVDAQDRSAGLDLLLNLPGDVPVRKRRAALEEALRDAIRQGRIVPGARLPASRQLALDLGLARNTVAEAYGQLVEEGWLVAQHGSGTRVADTGARTGGPPSLAVNDPIDDVAPGERRLDLSPGRPDLSHFPRADWLKASRRAVMDAPSSSFGYPDPQGLLSFREILVDYLARVRGVRTSPDRIIITSGFTQALALLCSTLASDGSQSVSVESYGLEEHRAVVEAAGLRAVPRPVDDDGADLEGIDDDAVLLTPTHQFPTGFVLSESRRRRLIEWAKATDGLIIEDDYDGEFRFDRTNTSTLQTIDPDRVAYIGTASKSLAPGLSIAWLVLPERLVGPVTDTKIVSDGFTGVFEQLNLEEFIRSGSYDHHVRNSRLLYRRRRDILIQELSERSPDTLVTGVAAGLHAVVQHTVLSANEERILRDRAERAGLSVRTLSSFSRGPATHQFASLVIGYASPPDHEFAKAVELLCHVLR